MRFQSGQTAIDILGQEVLVKWSGYVANDGIGAYEYWGMKCYDRGHDYLTVESIIPVFTDETKAEQRVIKRLIDENFGKYAESITSQLADEA